MSNKIHDKTFYHNEKGRKDTTQDINVGIIGGGLSGLANAIYLAKAGFSVTI